MMRVTCWPSFHRPAEGVASTLRALASRIKSPHRYSSKNTIGRWAPGEFRDGYRNLAHFVEASAIVLDLDSGNVTREQVERAFVDLHALGHTTWTPGRWRVVVVLDRSVTLADDEFGRVRRAVIEHAERHGLAPEIGQSAAHCYALPALGGAPYEWLETRGALFDVDAALARFPKPEPLPELETRMEDGARTLARATAYLTAMPGAISGESGHDATFNAALALVRGFALEPDVALSLLVEVHNPMCSPQWSVRDLRHKVRSAQRAQRVPVGYLADRGQR